MITVLLLTCGCNQAPGPTPPSPSTGTAAAKDSANGPTKADTLVSSELTIKGVGLGSSRTDVEAALGKPERTDKAPQQNMEFYDYDSQGFSVGISSDNRVHVLSVSAPAAAKTQKGIGIGSSANEVKSAYGDPDADGLFPLKSNVKDVFLMINLKDSKVKLLYASWGYK